MKKFVLISYLLDYFGIQLLIRFNSNKHWSIISPTKALCIFIGVLNIGDYISHLTTIRCNFEICSSWKLLSLSSSRCIIIFVPSVSTKMPLTNKLNFSYVNILLPHIQSSNGTYFLTIFEV